MTEQERLELVVSVAIEALFDIQQSKAINETIQEIIKKATDEIDAINKDYRAELKHDSR